MQNANENSATNTIKRFKKSLRNTSIKITISSDLLKKHHHIIACQLINNPELSQTESNAVTNAFIKKNYGNPIYINLAEVVIDAITAIKIMILGQPPNLKKIIIDRYVNQLITALSEIYQEFCKLVLDQESIKAISQSIRTSVEVDNDEHKTIDLILDVCNLNIKTSLYVTDGIMKETFSKRWTDYTEKKDEEGIDLEIVKKATLAKLTQVMANDMLAITPNFNLFWGNIRERQIQRIKLISTPRLTPLIMGNFAYLFFSFLIGQKFPILAALFYLYTLYTGYEYSQTNRDVKPIKLKEHDEKKRKLLVELNSHEYLEQINLIDCQNNEKIDLFIPKESNTSTFAKIQTYMTEHSKPSHSAKPTKKKIKNDDATPSNKTSAKPSVKIATAKIVNWNKADYPTFDSNDKNCPTKAIINSNYRQFSYIPPTTLKKLEEKDVQDIVLAHSDHTAPAKGGQGIVFVKKDKNKKKLYRNDAGEILEINTKIKLLGDETYGVRVYGHDHTKGEKGETGYQYDGFYLTHGLSL